MMGSGFPAWGSGRTTGDGGESSPRVCLTPQSAIRDPQGPGSSPLVPRPSPFAAVLNPEPRTPDPVLLLISPLWPRDSGPVSADQAVFTSVRGPTGSGYRLIAAGAGVRPEEKQELTQRCPSHASLTSDAADADALIAWRLRTGRYAVVWSRHAGPEPTARGGHRVHSHAAILDETGYRRFDYSPTRVQFALMDALDPEPILEPRAALEPLPLSDPSAAESVWLSALGVGCRRELVFALVERLLAGGQLVVTGVPAPIPVLDAVLAALPLALRPAVSVCVGLKLSTGREAKLTFIDQPCEQARQRMHGKNVEWFDASDDGPRTKGAAQPLCQGGGSDERHGSDEHRGPDHAGGSGKPRDHDDDRGASRFSAWTALMRRWWTDGRRTDFCRLAAHVTQDASAEALNRLAGICHDAELLAAGNDAADLAPRYQAFVPANDLERELAARIRERIAARRRPTDVPAASGSCPEGYRGGVHVRMDSPATARPASQPRP